VRRSSVNVQLSLPVNETFAAKDHAPKKTRVDVYPFTETVVADSRVDTQSSPAYSYVISYTVQRTRVTRQIRVPVKSYYRSENGHVVVVVVASTRGLRRKFTRYNNIYACARTGYDCTRIALRMSYGARGC